MVLKRKAKEENPKIAGYYSFIIFLLFVIADRMAKIWATNLKAPIDLGWVRFIYATNTGAGFSILVDQNIMLAWIAVIALGIIIYYYNHFPRVGFLMIMAGIVGNLSDRVLYGYVIDFIDFKFWPVFNIADSLLFLGVLYTIINWHKRDKELNARKSKKSSNRPAIRRKR